MDYSGSMFTRLGSKIDLLRINKEIEMTNIYTLDLNFQGIPNTIASYLIPHSKGLVLVESGPGSTLPALEKHLAKSWVYFC